MKLNEVWNMHIKMQLELNIKLVQSMKLINAVSHESLSELFIITISQIDILHTFPLQNT